MHNTLARSEYGLLDQDTHNPRPNYWAALLWSKLMGNQVYEGGQLEPGVDMFVHSPKKQLSGKSILILNTMEKATAVTIPTEAIQYLLTAEELITKKVKLNNKELAMTIDDTLPVISGKKVKKGKVELPAHCIMFLEFNR